MSKSLLYIGNKLSGPNNNSTSIDTLGKLLELEGYTLFYSSTETNKILRLIDMMTTTFRLRNKVDYVLIDVYSTLNFWFAFIISQLCRFFNLRYICKLHGGNLPYRFAKNPILCGMIFNHAHLTIAPSGYLISSFISSGFSNIKLIPNSIEIHQYPFKIRTSFRPRLLWVRSFDAIYNPLMAVKVASKLKKDFPNIHLCMVGPDKDGSLEKVKKYALKQNIEVSFTGKLSKIEWIKLSEEYDVFLNTTHFDNTPVSVIEALALGIPVVSTNVGGIPFLLTNNENSLLVNDNSVTQMALAVKKIINHQELASHLIYSGRTMVERFDWEVVKKEWIAILK